MDTAPLRVGYCLSLSGALASNGKTARLAHEIWREDVNARGGLLGRPVELVCLDDQTNPNLVAGLYERLLDVHKVDVVVGGYGDNSVAPAMPLIMERKRFFLGLMALAVNARFNYPQYFVMIPTGPHPHLALTEGFFQIGGQQNPKPETVAVLVAEVTLTSLLHDRKTKRRVYARSGIPEYWIQNLKTRELEVYREPAGDTYRISTVLRLSDQVSPLFAPEASIPVERLFPKT